MNEQIIKRIKSFAWRTGMMILALVLNELSVEITTLGFSPATTVILGLFLGEVSKYLNTYGETQS